MKIVVTDGHTLNPGDLDNSELEKLGELVIYKRSNREETILRLQDADIAVVNKTILDRDILEKLPHLRYIAVTATGYNNLDVPFIKEKKIPTSNVTNYGSYAVAQHAFALLLELTNLVGLHNQECRQGKWYQSSDFCFWSQPMTELYGKKIGIIGLGHIGSKMAEMAKAFGMEVFYHGRVDKNIPGYTYLSTPQEIFSSCDVISLHCALNEQTNQIVNSASLSYFKPNAILINTSRGGLIQEEDLLNALDQGQIRGVGLDVLSEEPPRKLNSLINHPRCIVTPHNAWAAQETRQRMLDITIDNIKSFLQGNPKNLIP